MNDGGKTSTEVAHVEALERKCADLTAERDVLRLQLSDLISQLKTEVGHGRI